MSDMPDSLTGGDSVKELHGARATGIDLEVLRRRIFVLKSRGLTIGQISAAVGKSRSTVSHHLTALKLDKVKQAEGAGAEELTGELLLLLEELLQEALRNMTLVEQGSPMRAQWLAEAARRLDAKAKFMLTVGLVKKAEPLENDEMRDLRRMSDDEIRKERAQLRAELAKEPVDLGAAGMN
jgi:DNA-binding transcriptional ArsR family regulator